MPNTTASEITHFRDVDTHFILSDFQDSSKDLTEKLMQSAGGLLQPEEIVWSRSSRLYISLQNTEKKSFTFCPECIARIARRQINEEPGSHFFSVLKRAWKQLRTAGHREEQAVLEKRSNCGRSNCIRTASEQGTAVLRFTST